MSPLDIPDAGLGWTAVNSPQDYHVIGGVASFERPGVENGMLIPALLISSGQRSGAALFVLGLERSALGAQSPISGERRRKRVLEGRHWKNL